VHLLSNFATDADPGGYTLPIENKYVMIAAVIGFLLTLWLTDGSMIAAFGILALVAGIGWAVRRIRG